MNKRITSSVLAALMIAGSTSFSAFAAMKIGTVVIGNKAFDLAYANDPSNITEITAAIIEGGAVYVKNFEGNWIDNITSQQVNASIIPAVIYKNATGVTNFDAEDKDQGNKLSIESISAIDSLTVANGTTADKIGLPATVTVTLSDKTTDKVKITWNTNLFDGAKTGDITIKGILEVEAGKSWTLTEAQREVSIKITVNGALVNAGGGNASGGGGGGGIIADTTQADLNSGTTLATKDYTITSSSATYGPTTGTTTVNGNVSVSNPTGLSLILKNLNITGTLTINYGEGNVVLEDVTVNGVNVSNVGSNSLHIKGNTVITTLVIDDANNDAHIIVEENASVRAIVVNSGANIEVDKDARNAQPFANVTLSPAVSTSVITLKGTFDTVLVNKNAKVVMDAASEITNQIIATAPLEFTVPLSVTIAKVNIQPNSPSNLFTLSGNLANVTVNGSSTINIISGVVQVTADNNTANINIATSIGSTVYIPTGSSIAVDTTKGGSSFERDDSSVVTSKVTGLSFTATGTNAFKMGGILTWTAPANVSNVTSYVAYASTDGITKGAKIGSDVLVGVNQLVIPETTEVVGYIIVVAKNSTCEALPNYYASISVTIKSMINITSNSFNENVVANGEIINIKLDIVDNRTIYISGNSPKVVIDAASANVVLSRATIGILEIKDGAPHSVYVKDGSIESLTVEDPNNDAHIVTLGTASIMRANIKSGATIDSQSSSLNPFGDITINTSGQTVGLIGNLATSNVVIESARRVDVEATLNNVTISDDVDSVKIKETSVINKLSLPATSTNVISVVTADGGVASLDNILKVVNTIVDNGNLDFASMTPDNRAEALTARQNVITTFLGEIAVNLGSNTEGAEYSVRNAATLATLLSHKNDFLGLNQLTSMSEAVQLRYASSFRAMVRSYRLSQTQLQYEDVQRIIISTYSAIRPILETNKFKGNLNTFEVDMLNNSVDTDITDSLIQFINPLSDFSTYTINSVLDTFSFNETTFELEGEANPYVYVSNGRLFVRQTENTKDIYTNVMLTLMYMQDGSSTNLRLMLHFPLQRLASINAGTATLQNYITSGITNVTENNFVNVNSAVVAARAIRNLDLTKEEVQIVVNEVVAIVSPVVNVDSLLQLTEALVSTDIETININSDIIIPEGTNVNVRAGQNIILNSKLTVIGGIEVNGSIGTPLAPPLARMARMAITVNNPKLEVMGNGRIDVKAGSALRFNSFADIITPTQDSVLLYGGSKVEIGGKQYIGNKNSDALIELSNFTGSNRPVAGYFLNGDGMLLLVIFEKAEVLKTEDEVLDINILVKAGGQTRQPGEIKIPSFNIIKEAVGGIVIEANGNLIAGDKTIVAANGIDSVFNAIGGDTDNRRGIRFFKSQYNSSLMASIRGDVIMNKPFSEAIIFPEYFKYNDYHRIDLNPTLDIKFVPSVGDFIGDYWINNAVPLMGMYKLLNGVWASAPSYQTIKDELVAVIAAAGTKIESTYTAESWIVADLVNVLYAADLIAKNDNSTEIDIIEALKTITDSEAKLVIAPIISENIKFIGNYSADNGFNITLLKGFKVLDGIKLVIECTSPNDRIFSLFNPPSGDMVMNVYTDKIKTGENIVTIDLAFDEVTKLKEAGKITLKFWNNESANYSYIYFEPIAFDNLPIDESNPI